MPAAAAILPARPQRVDGEARVGFGRRGITALYQRAPSRLLFPVPAAGNPPQAVSILTSGGLTGGDRARLSVHVAPGCVATVTTQAAERFYRVAPGDMAVRVETRLDVADGASCEWLAQEAILYDRARLRRSLVADLGADARLLAVESLVFGRAAMGELFATGLVHDSWRIHREGRLIWADALHLEGDIRALAANPFALAGARALATLLYAGPDAGAHLPLARRLTAGPGAGATCLDDLLILRFLDSDAHRLRRAVVTAGEALRAAALGLPPRLPDVWYC